MMSVKRGQDRLLRIADYLDRTEFTPRQELVSAEFSWLANALRNIAKGGGVDIADALGVKAKRGQRKNREAAREQSNRKMLALSWLYSAMAPESCDGLGLTLEEACARAGDGKAFGLTEETIRSYWGKEKQLREQLKSDYGFFNLED